MSEQTVKSESLRYVNQIRLAGMGVVGKIQKEGSKLFDALVEEGEQLRARRQETTHHLVTAPLTALKDTTLEQLSKLQQLVGERSIRTLNWLGLPTHEDIQSLTQRVEEINTGVQELIVTRKSQPRTRNPATEEGN